MIVRVEIWARPRHPTSPYLPDQGRVEGVGCRGRWAAGIRANSRRGTALLEMAIVLPFLAFLFLVALDFCRAYFSAQTVQNCAYAGALYASGVAQPAPGVTSDAAAQQASLAEGVSLNPGLRSENITVTTNNGDVTVTVSYDFVLIAGFPGLPQTLRLVRSVTMPVAPKVGQ